MGMWYFSVDGRAEGPVEEAVILESLGAGKLTLVDLVFREGDDRWRPIGEVPEFKNTSAKVSLPPSPVEAKMAASTSTSTQSPQDRTDAKATIPPHVSGGPFRFDPSPQLTWVLLQKVRHGNEDRFLQEGPFSFDELSRMLTSGKASYSDYVWRPGYKRWARLGNLPEFDRRIKVREGDTTINLIPVPQTEMATAAKAESSNQAEGTNSASRAELLGNVVRAQVLATFPPLVAGQRAEPPPPETDGRDWAEETNRVDLNSLKAASRTIAPKSELKNASESAPVVPPPRIPDHPDDEQKTVVYGVDLDNKTFVYGSDAKTTIYGMNGHVEGKIPSHSIRPLPRNMPLERSVLESKHDFESMREVESEGNGIEAGSAEAAEPVDGIYIEELAERKPTRRWLRPALISVAAVAVVVIGLQVFYQLGGGDKVGMADDDANVAQSKKGDEAPSPKSAPPEAPGTSLAGATNSAPAAAPPVRSNAAPVAAAGTGTGAGTSAAPTSAKGDADVPSAAAPASGATGATSAGSGTAPGAPAASGPEALPLPNGMKAMAPATGPTTVLEVVPVRTDSARPYFVVQTNAPVGETIWFSLRARSGEILRLPSFQTTLSVKRTGGEIPSFDLANLRPPAGRYRVDVVAGSLRRTQNVFIGTKNDFFENEMEKHLKQIAFQQQAEKKALFYSARKMEMLAKDLGDQYFKTRKDARRWKTYYTGWRKEMQGAQKMIVDSAAPERRNDLAYPDEVFALKGAALRLMEQAEALNESVVSNTHAREVASGSGNLAIVKEFSRLKAQAAAISSRR